MQYVVNGVSAGCGYALLALGVTLLYSSDRFFNFALGGVFSLAAYVAYVLVKSQGMNGYLSAMVALAVGAAIGGLMARFVLGPVRRARGSELCAFVASLGVLLVLENAISLAFGDETRVIRGWNTVGTLTLGGARMTSIQAFLVAVTAVSFLIVWLGVRFTSVGLLFRSLVSEPELALVIGVDVNRLRILAAVAAAALASVAGVLAGYDTDISPTMGFGPLLIAVVAVIAGGASSIPGVLLSSLLLGLAQHMSVAWLSSRWQDASSFAILCLFLLVRPHGFLGKPPARRTD